MLIEILVEVMEPSYVCSVSSEPGFVGTQPGVLCGPWEGSSEGVGHGPEALGWGVRK